MVEKREFRKHTKIPENSTGHEIGNEPLKKWMGSLQKLPRNEKEQIGKYKSGRIYKFDFENARPVPNQTAGYHPL